MNLWGQEKHLYNFVHRFKVFDVFLFQEPNANSVAWNTHNEVIHGKFKKRLWFETFFSLTEDAVGNITPSKYCTVSISHGMRFCKTTCSMYSIKKKQQLAKLYVLSSRLCQLSQLSIQDSVESAMKKKPHTQPCLFTVFTFKRIFWINDVHQNTSFDLRCLWIFFLSFFSRTCCVFLVVVCWTSRPVTFLYTNKNYRFVKYSRRPSFSLHCS